MWLEMLQKNFSIPPSNITLFASKENYDQVVDKLWDENSEQYEAFRDNPGNVKEESLPIYKLVCHFISRKISPEVLKEAH